MKYIKLGIIGYSEGNGHPYSWSAIINGYNKEEMLNCEYPIIIQYLEEEYTINKNFKDVEVTNIWSQDNRYSTKIAKASKILKVNDNMEKLIEEVDAVILARDDYEYNLEFAKKILVTGKPLLIDKPISISVKDTISILKMQQYKGQIFTCSGTRYSKSLELTSNEMNQIGRILIIKAKTPNNWDKYSIHVITPIIKLIGEIHEVKVIQKIKNKRHQAVHYMLNNIIVEIDCTGIINNGINMHVVGTKGTVKKEFSDSYQSFTKMLEEFIKGVKEHKEIISESETISIVNIIEKGLC